MESEDGWIDATVIEHNGAYYRFTKNETKKFVAMERGEGLDGTFTEVSGYTVGGIAGNTLTGFEGPIIYEVGGKWCLLMDNYAKRLGYKAFVTDDISKAVFEPAEVEFDGKYRHGSVLKISKQEYDRLIMGF
jgi:hypothetical protein